MAQRIAAVLRADFAAIRDATLPFRIIWPGRPKTCIGVLLADGLVHSLALSPKHYLSANPIAAPIATSVAAAQVTRISRWRI
jgi:hypothetical protein